MSFKTLFQDLQDRHCKFCRKTLDHWKLNGWNLRIHPFFKRKSCSKLQTIIFRFYVDVSANSGTPKSSIWIGFSIINHPFWGTPKFWKYRCSSSQANMPKKGRHVPDPGSVSIHYPILRTFQEGRSGFLGGLLQIAQGNSMEILTRWAGIAVRTGVL